MMSGLNWCAHFHKCTCKRNNTFSFYLTWSVEKNVLQKNIVGAYRNLFYWVYLCTKRICYSPLQFLFYVFRIVEVQIFLLLVRAAPFLQHCHLLSLCCTNGSIFSFYVFRIVEVRIRLKASSWAAFFFIAVLLSSFGAACICLVTLTMRFSWTWFMVVSFPGSKVHLDSTCHLDFLGLLGGCIRITS